MKKSFRWMIVALVVLMAAGIALGVGAYDKPEVENNTISFAEFERQLSINNALYSGDVKVDENYVDGSRFMLKRLIVTGKLPSDNGAEKVVSYGDLHVLYYLSEEDTQSAYEKLSCVSSINVIPDSVETASGYADVDYDYSGNVNWGAEVIDAQGYLNYLAEKNVTKEAVVVILDTGINTTHETFRNRLLKDENGKIVGYSYKNSSKSYNDANLAIEEGGYSFEDDNGHGSHVAGIVCSLTPENVKILPIKIGDKGGYSDVLTMISAFKKVIEYSEKYNILSVNISFSGSGKTNPTERDTFNEQAYKPLAEKGILVATSAGNDRMENNLEGLDAVVVSAVKKQFNGEYVFDKSYSDFGSIVDVAAPGSYIKSAYIEYVDTDGKTKDTKYCSGTSMASPQVAGAIALLKLDPANEGKSAAEIENELYRNSLDAGDPGKDSYYGNGIVSLKYFAVEESAELSLSVTKDGATVTDVARGENFESGSFTISATVDNDSEYKIYYATTKDGKLAYPTSVNVKSGYAQELNADLTIENQTINIYVVGFKFDAEGNVVGRTNMCRVYYFYEYSEVMDYYGKSPTNSNPEYIGNHKKITIPEGTTLKYLGADAFGYGILEEIYLPSSIIEIAGRAFIGCKNLKTVYAPGVTGVYVGAFFDSGIEYVTDDIAEYEERKATPGGCVYLPNATDFIGSTFGECKNLKYVKLRNFTGERRGGDFAGCTSLSEINLPNLKYVGDEMFYNCTSYNQPFTVTKDMVIESRRPFAKCTITEFVVENGNTSYYTDGKGLYSKDGLIAYAIASENKDYTIAENVKINGTNVEVTSIGEYAFYSVKFDSLTIPSTITRIGRFLADSSTIGTLYYNAERVKAEQPNSYYLSNGIFTPFNEIDTIYIGENVLVVPRSLFSRAKFNTIHIGHRNTRYEESCFSNVSGEDKKERILYLDYPEETYDLSWTDSNGRDSGLYTNSSYCNVIYAKKRISDDVLRNAEAKDGADGKAPTHQTYFDHTEGEYFVHVRKRRLIVYASTYNHTPTISVLNGETEKIIDASKKETKEVAVYVISGVETSIKLKVFGEKYYLREVSLIDKEKEYKAADLERDADGYYVIPILKEQKSTHLYIATSINQVTTTVNCDYSRGYYGSNKPTTSDYGDDKTFTFTPNKGYRIARVLVDGVEVTLTSDNKYTLENVTADHTIDVEFELLKYNITATASEGGTISPSGVQTVEYNGYYSFRFSANPGYRLARVLVDGSEVSYSGSQYTVQNVVADHTISAEFEKLLSIDAVMEYGTITDEGNNTVHGKLSVNPGESKTIKFKANAGYRITRVIVDNESQSDLFRYNSDEYEYTFENVVGDHKIYVATEKIEYTIYLYPGEGGTIDGSTSAAYDEGRSYSARAKEGYRITRMYIRNTATWDIVYEVPENEFDGIVTEKSYLLMPIKNDHNVYAEFERLSYTVETTAGEGGTISGQNTVLFGESELYTFTPKTGYRVAKVLVDGVEVPVANQYLLKNVRENHTVSVEFEKTATTFKVKLFVGSNGKVTANGQLDAVAGGDGRTFTITPDSGYVLDRVTVNGTLVTVTNNVFVLENVTKDTSIIVSFKKDVSHNTDTVVDNDNSSSEKETHTVSDIFVYVALAFAILSIMMTILTMTFAVKYKQLKDLEEIEENNEEADFED